MWGIYKEFILETSKILRLKITKLVKTRGHARFARSPLVIRLGDSRIRRGNSGYGEVGIEFGVALKL